MTTPTQQPAKREVFTLPLGDREIKVYALDEGQVLVATRVQRAFERGEVFTALMTFGDLLDAIIIDDEDRRYAYRGVVDHTIETPQYLELLTGVLEKMKGEEAAPNRARKRAAPRARR